MTATIEPPVVEKKMAKKSSAGKSPAEDPGQKRLAEARAKNLDLAISQIQKDYGEGAIMRMGEESNIDCDVIPTGNLLIDRALGVGGFPRGRIVEIYGPESSGKTTLTLTAIAQAQKRGGLAGFVAAELRGICPAYRRNSGPRERPGHCGPRLSRGTRDQGGIGRRNW